MTAPEMDAERALALVRAGLARRLTDPAAAASAAADDDLFESGLLDSIGLFDLIVDLERAFGVRLAAGELEPGRLLTLAGIAEIFRAAALSRPG